MRVPGTSRAARRLDGMLLRAVRLVLVAVLAADLAAACGSTPVPTSGQTLTASPPPATQPPPSAPPVAPSLLPLPEGLSGIPGDDEPATAEVEPVSPRDELEIGVERNFALGHCGLISPIDIDGS